MRIVEKSFTCERDGLTIRGKYYLPEMAGEKKYPCVILSHGFTGNYTDMEPFGRDFAELGYAALYSASAEAEASLRTRRF